MRLSPSKEDFIDIHTHFSDIENYTFRILNIFSDDYTAIPSARPLSIGLHPWHINETTAKAIDSILGKTSHLPQVKAIGETGLDRMIKISMDKQEEVFITHIKYAITSKKPLIIHCVRAFNELMRIKNKYESEISWIVHGFSGNLKLAEELVANGFYISIGTRLLNDKNKKSMISSHISSDKIFIETDDKLIQVRDIYKMVAELYNINISSLQKIIRENYHIVFKE